MSSAPTGADRLRIGHAERAAAIAALDTHLGAGRLDDDEYEERVRRVGLAHTHGELAALFADLPDPRPSRPLVSPAALVPAADDGWRPVGSGWGPAVVLTPLVLVTGLVLLRLPDGWIAFLVLLGGLAVGTVGHRRTGR